MNIYTTLSKLSLTVRYSWDAQIISNFNCPKGRLIFSGEVRRKKKGFVRVSPCASVANKNIYLFISVCPVGRADDTGCLRSSRQNGNRRGEYKLTYLHSKAGTFSLAEGLMD